MLLLSCANCWHNALQNDEIGLRQGYCVRHDKVLNLSSTTTCGQLMRKDLPVHRAREENVVHRRTFADGPIVLVRSGKPANGELSDSERDFGTLRTDDVADQVLDFGHLGTKIEALATLGRAPRIPGRSELAFLSLSRGYVTNCIDRGEGSWTSGLNLLRWTLRRLAVEPTVALSDLRFESQIPAPRQIELAQWSLILLRLTFVADLAIHAGRTEPGHPLAELADLLDDAALEVEEIQPKKLLGWIAKRLSKRLDKALPPHEIDSRIRELNAATSAA